MGLLGEVNETVLRKDALGFLRKWQPVAPRAFNRSDQWLDRIEELVDVDSLNE